MNDTIKNVQEELVEVNPNEGREERLVKISKNLSEEEKRKLIALLKEYKDMFAWRYEEMPSLDPKSVTHKLNPKNEFLLPNVDILVDTTAGHECFSFMDGYSGYNQIFMELTNTHKATFWTSFGNYYFKMIPFGLKNASATYQRTMTLIFRDMLHKQVDDYVDDLVVKAKSPAERLLHLRQVFK